MDTDVDRPILVAVETAEEATSALAFAEQEALRQGCSLKLLHVISPPALTPPEALVWQDFVGPAEEMLTALAKGVEQRLDHRVPVAWEAARGAVVRTIVEHGARSRLVVVAGEDTGRLERLVTGQVRNGVAARVHAPVVCVPAGWSVDAGRRDLVVVGVDDPEPDPALVRAALAAGAERGCSVRFVHAWWFTEPLDDTVFTRRRAREWSLLMEHSLERALERVGDRPEDVRVEVRAMHQRPADALVEQSRGARLLVLGRRDPRLPFGSHLGPVVRALLRRAECPVMVVEATSHAMSEEPHDRTR